MDQDTFLRQLSEKNFPEPVLVKKDAGNMGVHSHSFEPLALIIQGSMSIDSEGTSRDYRVGDIFHLRPNQVHSERYGPEGVTYLVSRKE